MDPFDWGGPPSHIGPQDTMKLRVYENGPRRRTGTESTAVASDLEYGDHTASVNVVVEMPITTATVASTYQLTLVRIPRR
jgi:hypothetical protein